MGECFIIYKNYQIRFDKNAVTVKGIRDFDLAQTFESGQCFRWRQQKDGGYTGVAFERVVHVQMPDNETLVIHNADEQDFWDIWYPYFDLDTDYTAIKKVLAQDPVMNRAIAFGGGIRILRQAFEETVISFIISQNNHIPRIKKIIEDISQGLGKALTCNGQVYYAFPGMDCFIIERGERVIADSRAGYRCGYILSAAKTLYGGFPDYSELKRLSDEAVKTELLKLKGVGEKVADCILLYSGLKRDAFPVDRWIGRVMQACYPDFLPEGSGHKTIREFAQKHYGENAGIAQQYLFYYAIKN